MSWLQKLKQGLSKSSQKVSDSLKSLSSLSSFIGASKLDASSLEEVEDALIGADLGTASAVRLAEAMRKHKFDGPVTANSLALALADATSVRIEDLVATDQRFPDRTGEIYHLAHNPAHRFYYAAEMERDEVILIKSWDSRGSDDTTYPAHGAFQYPNQDPAAPPRESIELRTYVVFEPGNPKAGA